MITKNPNQGEILIDTLFMTVLFLARAGAILNRKDCIDEANYQFLLHIKYLLNKQEGLFLSLIHILDPHYWQDTPEQIKPGKWSPEFETDKALEYMENHKDDENPFALFVSWNPPHLPYELVPDEYYEKFKDADVCWRPNVPKEMRTPEMETKARQYFAAVYGLDLQFGRIYEYLRENGLEENTILVLSADHGEMMGSHSKMSKNNWYEESIHIPLMIRQKGRLDVYKRQAILRRREEREVTIWTMPLFFCMVAIHRIESRVLYRK